MILYVGREPEANTKLREGSELWKTMGIVFHAPARLEQRGWTQPLEKRANVTMLDAQSTATELGRDRDIRRNVPMGAWLAPQPKVQEKPPVRRRITSRKKVHIVFRHTYPYQIPGTTQDHTGKKSLTFLNSAVKSI